MISLWDFLRDLRHVEYGFLAASLLMAMVATMTAGVSGTYVVVRGREYLLDMSVCSALPAAMVCLFLPGSPLLSTLAAVGASLIVTIVYRWLGVVAQPGPVRIASLAVMGVGLGAAGLVMAWRRPGNIVSQLAGSMRASTMNDLVITTFLGSVAIIVLVVAHRFLTAAGFHRRGLQRLVWRSTVLDAVLACALALTVVVLARPVGVAAGLAVLLVVPTVAWYVCRRVSTMILMAASIGALAAWVGVYAAWCSHLPQGPQIVVAAAAVGAVVALLSPLRLLAARWSVRRPGPLRRAAASSRGATGASPGQTITGPVVVSTTPQREFSGGVRGRS